MDASAYFPSLSCFAAWWEALLSQALLRRPLWTKRCRFFLFTICNSSVSVIFRFGSATFVCVFRREHRRSWFLRVWQSCQRSPCCRFHGNRQKTRGGEKSPRTGTSEGWEICGVKIEKHVGKRNSTSAGIGSCMWRKNGKVKMTGGETHSQRKKMY